MNQKSSPHFHGISYLVNLLLLLLQAMKRLQFQPHFHITTIYEEDIMTIVMLYIYVVLGITSTEKKYLAKQKSEMVDFSSTSSLYEIFIECNILLNSFSSQRSDAQIHQMRESVKVLIFFYEMRHWIKIV